MVSKDLGFILKRFNFRETSVITTLYLHNYGKIRGILKGFYTPKKEFSSSLNVFSLNEFIFYPKHSEIWLVSGVDSIREYPALRSNIAKARVAGLFANIVDKVMQLQDPNKQVFALIQRCFDLIDINNESTILYIFLIKFLTFSGFKPEFGNCLNCKATLRYERLFSVARGGFICKSCSGADKDLLLISKQAWRSLTYIQDTDFPLVQRLNISPKCQDEIFYILKEFIAYHFEFDLASYIKNRNLSLTASKVRV